MCMEFYARREATARKEHECEYCRDTISAGQKYSYETGKFEGDFFTRKLCLTCDMILREFMSEADEEYFEWSYVSEFLNENYCAECHCYHECNEMPARCKNIKEKFSQQEEMK